MPVEQRFEDGSVVWASQYGFDFFRKAPRFIDGPLRQETCVHHEERSLAVMKGLVPKPVH
jgi:hypothetical protein